MRRHLVSLLSWMPVGVVVSDKLFTLHYDACGALEPSIARGSLLLISRLHAPQALVRGDPVLADDVSGTRRLLRRVIALQGDYVRARHGDEPPTIVPRGCVWLEGGHDEAGPREAGPVPAALVTGTVVAVVNTGKRVAREPSDRVVQPALRYS